MIQQWFCMHDWKMISEKTTVSKLDEMTSNPIHGRVQTFPINFEKMTERYFIQLLKCNKCGKLKRYETTI